MYENVVSMMLTGSNLASLPAGLIRHDISRPLAITVHFSKGSRANPKASGF
ncbi:hypothetical protein [Ralstonia solanacearum]|uniref:hypothetical protein n=1 Tax=Ralstonia solanacearum TaxID=305 RepID=UPI002480E80A|nr:hypothetical protein [Ralstonia solanacearum]